MSCHKVPEGTVLGATRVSYSPAGLDARIARNLVVSGGLNVSRKPTSVSTEWPNRSLGFAS